MALSSGSKIQISDINTALNGKLNTSGGTINGSLSVTGGIVATGIVKGMCLSANNGANNNIDFMHDSKAEGGYYLNFDKISSGSWLEIATVGSVGTISSSTIKTWNGTSGSVTLPSGGTWAYLITWSYSGNHFARMRAGSAAGGTAIDDEDGGTPSDGAGIFIKIA